jgi:hypothetical protein
MAIYKEYKYQNSKGYSSYIVSKKTFWGWKKIKEFPIGYEWDMDLNKLKISLNKSNKELDLFLELLKSKNNTIFISN